MIACIQADHGNCSVDGTCLAGEGEPQSVFIDFVS